MKNNKRIHRTSSPSKRAHRGRFTGAGGPEPFNPKNLSIFSFNVPRGHKIVHKQPERGSFNFGSVLKKASYGKKKRDIWGVEKYQNNEYLRYLSQKKEFNEEDYIEKIKSEIEIKFRQSKLTGTTPSRGRPSSVAQDSGPRPSTREQIDPRIFERNKSVMSKQRKTVLRSYEDKLTRKNEEIDMYIESMRIKTKDLNLNKFFNKSRKGLFLCELEANRDLPKKFKKLFGCEISGSRSHKVLYKDSKHIRDLRRKQRKFYRMVDKQADWIMFERMKKNEKIQVENEKSIRSKLKMIRDLKKYSIVD